MTKGRAMPKRKIQELTTGVHDFPTLIGDRENKYVDKTGLLYKLARRKTNAQYFISRPRRFGKSLMLSTLQAMFEGLSLKAAMRQIRERGYADKWKGGKRPVTLVGINFNSRKRNIDIPVIEPL